MEQKYWRINYQRNKILQDKSQKTFVIGANFGPYNTQEFFQRYKKFFEKCKDVCFREKASYDLFAENKRVRKATDIIFSVNLPKEKGNGLVISVINLNNRPELAEYAENYYQALAKLSLEAVKEKLPVCLMSFCDNEGDNLGIEQVLERMPEAEREKVDTYSYQGELKEALKVLGKAEYIVATRFHGTVLGLGMEKTVYPVIYSNKTTNMLKDIEFHGKSSDIRELKTLTLQQVRENAGVHIELEQIAKQATEQYAKL